MFQPPLADPDPFRDLDSDPLLEQIRENLLDNVQFDWKSKEHLEIGDSTLNRVRHLFDRFVTYQSNHRTTQILWSAHPWLLNNFVFSPRLLFLSPQADSGKTTAMEISERLMPKNAPAGHATAASIYRLVDTQFNATGMRAQITVDELDTMFSPTRPNNDLRNMIDNGAQRGKRIFRADNTNGYEVFGPMMLGGAMGIDSLDKTILSRCLVVHMHPRLAEEEGEVWNQLLHEDEVAEIRKLLGFWGEFVNAAAWGYEPVMPKELLNRDGLKWKPLLTVADLAGPFWAEQGRDAALIDVRKSKAREVYKEDKRLLADVRTVFAKRSKLTLVSMDRLLDLLQELPRSQWSKLTTTRMQILLSRYEIDPVQVTIWVDEANSIGIAQRMKRVHKGYKRSDFEDKWKRYLPQEGTSK